MFERSERIVSQRLEKLKGHLERENPILVRVVESFGELDRLAYRLGFLTPKESFATKISWWPLVSVLGTFSSGKSSFLNHYLGFSLQQTGNQAVDDHFTVICYARDPKVHVLPGLALDSDPRFPFYEISEKIERVAAGEGNRVDAYLQLKTCPSEEARGKILIDSPGFDADAQRTATLQITDHIVDLSDVVLVFFDARHPEPGAMRDTLHHLVGNTLHRPDAGKFLFVLNQIDTAASEDNTEEVVGAWQRALAEKGLTTGSFFCIYNPDRAVPIEDEATRERFRSKRDTDYARILDRIEQIQVQRSYRIVGTLEKTARDLESRLVPELQGWLGKWRSRTLALSCVGIALIVVLVAAIELPTGIVSGTLESIFEGATLAETPWKLGALGVIVLVVLGYVFQSARRLTAAAIERGIDRSTLPEDEREMVRKAFRRSARSFLGILNRQPAGWGPAAQKKVRRLIADADRYIQRLNDQFADPSGDGKEAA